MSFASFKHVAITALSVVVPEKEINIYDEAEYYGNSVKKIDRMRKMVGFYKHRVIDEDVTASDLAVAAAENLFSLKNIDRSTVDALLFVVQQPDYRGVGTTYDIHRRLKLSRSCSATEAVQGCVGWVYGLWIDSQMIESGIHKRVLLLNGDTPTKGIDVADRNVAPIFGDGGSATLLEYSPDEVTSSFGIETYSDGVEAILAPAGAARLTFDYRKPMSDEYNAVLTEHIDTPRGYKTKLVNGYLNGLAVFDFTMNAVPENIRKTMEFAKVEEKDTACLCLHQANKQIVQTVATAAGFPEEKAPYAAFETYGNNTMCSIPTTLAELYSETNSFSDKPYVCSGFGNGLVTGTVVLNLDKTSCTGVKTYVKPADHPTRQELIEYWKKKIQETS